MKLKEFLNKLNKMVKEDKSILDLEVITSKDDEGNGFYPVSFDPSIGEYDEEEREFKQVTKINAICVN